MANKTEVRRLWEMYADDTKRIVLAESLKEAYAIFSVVSDNIPMGIRCIGAETEAPNIFT